MMRILRRFDDVVLRFERGLIVVMLAAMTLAVFGDTMHRIFNSPVGKIDSFLLSVAPSLAGSSKPISLAIWFVLAVAVTYTAIRTRDRVELMPRGKALGWAVAIAAGAWLAIRLLILLMPNGLIWSQRMALSFMLWIGFVGASIATREGAHIVFEVADRIWPARIMPGVKMIARLVPTAFALFLALLTLGHTRYHYRDWAESGHVAGVFEGFAVPKWTVYGFLVFPFLMIAFRFLLHGVKMADPVDQAPEAEEALP